MTTAEYWNLMMRIEKERIKLRALLAANQHAEQLIGAKHIANGDGIVFQKRMSELDEMERTVRKIKFPKERRFDAAMSAGNHQPAPKVKGGHWVQRSAYVAYRPQSGYQLPDGSWKVKTDHNTI